MKIESSDKQVARMKVCSAICTVLMFSCYALHVMERFDSNFALLGTFFLFVHLIFFLDPSGKSSLKLTDENIIYTKKGNERVYPISSISKVALKGQKKLVLTAKEMSPLKVKGILGLHEFAKELKRLKQDIEYIES